MATQFWGRMRGFITKPVNKRSFKTCKFATEMSCLIRQCRKVPVRIVASKSNSRQKKRVNRLYFGEQRDAAPNFFHSERSRLPRRSFTAKVGGIGYHSPDQ